MSGIYIASASERAEYARIWREELTDADRGVWMGPGALRSGDAPYERPISTEPGRRVWFAPPLHMPRRGTIRARRATAADGSPHTHVLDILDDDGVLFQGFRADAVTGQVNDGRRGAESVARVADATDCWGHRQHSSAASQASGRGGRALG